MFIYNYKKSMVNNSIFSKYILINRNKSTFIIGLILSNLKGLILWLNQSHLHLILIKRSFLYIINNFEYLII